MSVRATMKAIVYLALALTTATQTALAASADAGAADEHWLRFQEHSTGLCAGLPGGRIRHQPYGVGGDRYVLHEGKELAAGTRDFSCSGQNPLVLGPRGALSYIWYDARPYTEVIHVEPRAVKIANFDSHPCVLLDDGRIQCARTWDNKESAQQKLADELRALGPIAEVIAGTGCALLASGDIHCGRVGAPGTTKLWSGVRQASILRDGGGCVVKLDGTVECAGENRYGERGTKAVVDRGTPTKVEGLRDIVEVAYSGTHACARDKAGQVFCWGRSAYRELGNAGFDAAQKLPQCALDEPAMEAARKGYEELKKRCRDQPVNDDPRRADPCGRALYNFERSGALQPIYKRDGICEVSEEPVRYNPKPTRVKEVSGAVALAVRSGMSCAITRASKLMCWGYGLNEPRVVSLPAQPVAQPEQALPVFGQRGPQLSVSGYSGVCVRDGADKIARAPFDASGRLQPALQDSRKATDAFCFPYMNCTLDRDGAVNCTSPEGEPTTADGLPASSPVPAQLRSFFRQPCLLREDGVLRCGRGFGSGDQMNRTANAMSAAGPIQDTAGGGACALYTDRTVRCMTDSLSSPPAVVLKGAKSVSADGLSLGPIPYLCAVMTDGTVQCLGPNEMGARGTKEKTTPEVANTVAGLTDIVSVSVSAGHACALDRGGKVYCWGAASRGQTGRAAYDAANKSRLCPFDKEAMASEVRRMERESPDCRNKPKPSHCSPVVYTRARPEGCEAPYDGVLPRRLDRPMEVPGISGAVAIATAEHVSCALLGDGRMGCWGNKDPDVTFQRVR